MKGKIVKGSVVLNRELTTQLGRMTAKPGFQLVSVFLGTCKDTEDPAPLERLHNLGFRQMAMYEVAVRIHTGTEGEREWRLAYSCLGHIDAVEAAIRFGNRMLADEFERHDVGDQAPFLLALTVGTIQLGPIDEDGKPFNGRGPAFFGWRADSGVSLEDHLNNLREKAQQLSL